MSKYKVSTDLKSLQAVSEGVLQNAAKFTQKLDALKTGIASQKFKMVDDVVRHMEPKDRKAAAAPFQKQFDTWHRNHLKESQTDRYAILGELQGAFESLSYARKEMCDPKRAATLHEVGSEARSRLENSLAKMGNAALKALAQKAEATGDKVLAAAVILQNDSIPTNSRQVDSFALADAVFGPDAEKAKAMCDAVDKAFQRAMSANRDFEGRKAADYEKIEQGLQWGPAGLGDGSEAA